MEEWRDVVGYEGCYQVSNLGEVKSLPRRGTKNKTVYRKPFVDKQGYIRVVLLKDKKLTNVFIHRLVAIAFIENKENKKQVNHKDFNKKNNRLGNLEWVTAKENTNHYIEKYGRAGCCLKGEKNVNAKLTAKQILLIRKEGFWGKQAQDVIKNKIVSKSQVYSILSRRTWKHI